MIAVFFYNKTTRVPGTGLAPTVTGANLKANTLVLNGDLMTESILPGWYTHSFTPSEEINYAFDFQPNDSNFIYAFNQSFFQAKSVGFGGYINKSSQYDFGREDRLNLKEIKESISKNIDLSEIKSHIDIAKGEIIDTIEETETEICSDIIRKTTELKKDNVTTRNLVRQKTKNLAELAQKQLDSEAEEIKMIEDIKEEFEEQENEDKEIEKEFDNQEMEDIKKEFEKQESEQESEQESKQ